LNLNIRNEFKDRSAVLNLNKVADLLIFKFKKLLLNSK
jgi:hypothetical protein